MEMELVFQYWYMLIFAWGLVAGWAVVKGLDRA